VLFRLIIAGALRAGLDPNALKLVSAVFVFLALVVPGAVRRRLRREPVPGGARG
jgi:putative ABC transport system permease protein